MPWSQVKGERAGKGVSRVKVGAMIVAHDPSSVNAVANLCAVVGMSVQIAARAVAAMLIARSAQTGLFTATTTADTLLKAQRMAKQILQARCNSLKASAVRILMAPVAHNAAMTGVANAVTTAASAATKANVKVNAVAASVIATTQTVATTDSAIAPRETIALAKLARAIKMGIVVANATVIKTNPAKAHKRATAMRWMISIKPVSATKAATCKPKSAAAATVAVQAMAIQTVAEAAAAAMATMAHHRALIPPRHPLATSRKTASANKAAAQAVALAAVAVIAVAVVAVAVAVAEASAVAAEIVAAADVAAVVVVVVVVVVAEGDKSTVR